MADRFSKDARRFAQTIMLRSSVTIFLLDKTDFEQILENPAGIGRILTAQAARIRDIQLAAPLWSGIERHEEPEELEESSKPEEAVDDFEAVEEAEPELDFPPTAATAPLEEYEDKNEEDVDEI